MTLYFSFICSMLGGKIVVKKILYDWGKIIDYDTNVEIKYSTDFVLGKTFVTYGQFFVDSNNQWKLIRMIQDLESTE